MPSLRVAKVLMPKSIPTVPPLWVGTSCFTSTEMETNHHPAREEMTALMIFLPASKRPVIGVTSTTTGFAKIHLLLWCGIQSNDVRAIHGYFFSCLIVRSNSASRSRSKTESIVSCCKAAIALSLRKLSRLILVVTTSCFIGVFYNTFTPCVKQEKQAQDERL